MYTRLMKITSRAFISSNTTEEEYALRRYLIWIRETDEAID